MDTVVYILQILIWVLCPVLIGLILLQGAAGDISSSFGGGGMLDSTLGVGAHRKMAKGTGVLAGIFFVVILILAYQHRRGYDDVVKPVAAPAAGKAEAPAVAPKPAAAKPEVTVEAPAAKPAEAPAVKVEAPAAKPAEAPAAPAVEAKAEAPVAPAAAPVAPAPAPKAEAPAAEPAKAPAAEAPKAEPAAPAPTPAAKP